MRNVKSYTGILWKREDKWIVKCLDEEGNLVIEYPVTMSSITATETGDNVCYGRVHFTLTSNGFALLSKKVQVNLQEGAALMVQFKVLSRLTEFFEPKSEHKTFLVIDSQMEVLLHTLSDDLKIYPRLTPYQEAKETYIVLDKIRKLLPKKSTLEIVDYVENQMRMLINEVFLKADI